MHDQHDDRPPAESTPAMTEAERALAHHRYATRLNLPPQVAHCASTLERTISAARYAGLGIDDDVCRAMAALDHWADAVRRDVDEGERERAASGADPAVWQRERERSAWRTLRADIVAGIASPEAGR
ncbi:MAG TPA: hypothetical protein VEP73_03875 [Actinomycetota bacterium]|nr:hypothetical protein [Actinomycetota bacterium]